MGKVLTKINYTSCFFVIALFKFVTINMLLFCETTYCFMLNYNKYNAKESNCRLNVCFYVCTNTRYTINIWDYAVLI